MTFRPLTPRMRQLPPKKSAVLSVLDVGASKVVSLIARLTPTASSESLPDRTHRCRVLGIGHQRSRGVKAGAIVDLDAAESAIRLAIDAAERMSGVEVDSVVVNMSGGRLSSQLFDAKIALRGKAVGQNEIHRVLEAASAAGSYAGRAVLHAAPTGFWLDGAAGVRDPKGMIGDELGAEMHVATCDAAAARNLMLAIERASSGSPVNWQPPPVSTSRRPAWMPWPAAFSRSRVISRISSTRGRMMRTSSDLGTWVEWSMSSPTRCSAIESRSSEGEAMQAP